MANPYSIHLVEPLSPEVAQRVANETASQLGGTPDKLAQLLTRNSGSRIARASSAAQADRVASILRKAGVSVQVVDPETIENVVPDAQNLEPAVKSATESQISPSPAPVPAAEHQVDVEPSRVPEVPVSNYDVNAGSSSSSSGGIPIVPDEIIPVDEAPYVLPTATQKPPSMSDLFPVMNSSIAPSSDPFATNSKDLFKADSVSQHPTAANDPFGAPAVDPFNQSVNSPFTAPTQGASTAPANDPFAAPANNPFAEPARNDPFAAPKNDPFGAPANNPFAASSAQDPFAPAAGMVSSNAAPQPAFDPFAQSQAPAAVSELPSQALKAQNRGTRRTSVRAQLLSSILFPILLVGLGITLFLVFQLNVIYKEQLRIRAVQAVSAIKQLDTPAFNQLTDPNLVSAARVQLQQTSNQLFKNFPDYEFLFLETHNAKIKINGPFSLESRIKITPEENETLAVTMEGFENTGSGEFTFKGVNYMGAITNIVSPNQEKMGDVYVALSLVSIPGSIINSLIPLLIGLAIVTVLAIAFAITLSTRLVRPIIAAADQANRISLGDLDRTVEIQSNDEIGDLLGSLERMRVSLKSVIGRLRRDR